MADYEILAGQRVDELIHELIRNQTLVKVSTLNHEYEKLTVVAEAEGVGVELHFKIEPPEGLIKALGQDQRGILEFEFSCSDGLPHRFRTRLREISTEIWLKRPEHIQRYQLRNNFRIKAPANAHAVCRLEEAEMRMTVENISLGGVFCHCPTTVKAMLFKDRHVENLDLHFSFGGDSSKVTIENATVRRVEGKSQSGYFGVAFEFVGMKPDVRRRLTQIVYDLQRDFLKNRLPV